MPLNLDTADQRAVHEVFEAASRAVATVQPVVGDERAMTGAFVSKVMEAAQKRGLDIAVRGFPDAMETVNGADIGIVITGPALSGGRTTEGHPTRGRATRAEVRGHLSEARRGTPETSNRRRDIEAAWQGPRVGEVALRRLLG